MIADPDEWVSIHTPKGVTIVQFGPQEIAGMKWGRELRDVSRADVTLPPPLDYDRLPVIAPWINWCSVYDSTALRWTGPIQRVAANKNATTITAFDPAALMARTRTPMTKRWESVDPSVPASQLWSLMAARHNLHASAVVKPDPDNDHFDFAVKADEKMLDATFGELVNLGLRWTVAAGVPLLGPASIAPIATLGEADFLDGLELLRDGSQTFNDVLVRGPQALARARVPLHDLNLQTIVNVDSMFGVSNVDRACNQYVRHTAAIRDAVSLPDGVRLHPDAPVSLDDLIPSARFVVDAYGLRTMMELESVEVRVANSTLEVSVKMESVTALPELADITSGAGAIKIRQYT